jgi:hypothetical protein
MSQAIDQFNKVVCVALKAKVLTKMKDPEPVFDMDLPKPNKWRLPELSYGPSAEVPSFSSAVSIDFSKALGRHLIANKPIKTGMTLKINPHYSNFQITYLGDILIVEECIVSAVSKGVYCEFCSFCLEPCMSLIPCKGCSVVRNTLLCRKY